MHKDLIPKGFNYAEEAQKIGQLVHKKQIAYGNSVESSLEIIKVFLKKYKQSDGKYLIPESLLGHLLLQVRIIDKQNRIFSNPDGDLMDESPYMDINGYCLIALKTAQEKAREQNVRM